MRLRQGPYRADVIGELTDAEIVSAVSTLPEQLRLLVQLVDIRGCSYAEAGRLTGLPATAVAAPLHRARCLVLHRLRATRCRGSTPRWAVPTPDGAQPPTW